MIEFRSVTTTFGSTTVLADVSLEIEDGEFVVLAGVNGCGKTTLLQHVNGLVEPDEGTVLVDGVSVSADLVAARTTVGMVFQQPRDQFVATTVGPEVAFGPENLGLPREEIDRRVANALAVVSLEGRESDRIDTLSGGEQARVAIAGALAMEPTHLLLDEPFTGLDYPTRESVWSHLEELYADGTGIVVATHDLRDLLDLVDRVLVLDDGQIVVDDPPARARSLLSRYGVRVP